MTISKLADAAGLNLQTIRYYENLGLLPEPARSESGYRQYDESYLEHINFIKNAQDLGFTLDEIKNLVSVRFDSEARGDHVKKFIKEKMKEVDSKIDDLKQLKAYLNDLDCSCSGDMPTNDCPIVNALEKTVKKDCCH